jgi:hypothetical protein
MVLNDLFETSLLKLAKRVFFLAFKVGQSWYLEGELRKKEQGNTIWYLGVDKITDLEKWS